MRNAVVSALVAGLFLAACGDDTGTGGNQGGGPADGGGGGTTDGGSPPTAGGGGSTTDGGGGSAPDPVCGDGTIDKGEDCDDDNTSSNDGCDAECQVEAGYECTGEPSKCVTDCGDGVLTGDEECDDNNAVNEDGCDMLCAIENGWECDGAPSVCTATCGDGLVAAGPEDCDDQNTAAGDGCSDECKIEPGFSCVGEPSVCDTNCGDGVIGGTEACDDQNAVDGDGCSAACAVEPGFDCTGEPSTCTAVCGDGQLAGTEACDDGNTTDGDCCSATCGVEAGCETEPNNDQATADDFAAHQVGGIVNGFVNPSGDANFYSVVLAVPGSISAETHDGILGTTCIGNDVDSRIRILDSTGTQVAVDDDGGVGFCSLATTGVLPAGTYYVVVDASPFDPTVTFDYALEVGTFVCGDGALDPGEQCDDSNTVDGDGCSALCVTECNSETEPNNSSATADALNAPGANCGAITPVADQDFWTFTTSAVTDIRVESFDSTGVSCNGGIDTFIELRAADGTTIIVSDDDDGTNNCSLINPTVDTAARHLAPGTYFVRIIEFGDNATIAGYRLGVTFTAVCGNGTVEGAEECDGGATCTATCDRIPVCGDGFIDAPENCDDSNTTNGDGCSSICQIEGVLAESEPNDDGATATATNDFSAANADGPVSVNTLVTASIGVAGDDDVFAITNPSASPIVVTAETFSDAAGTACATITTQINIRNATGTSLAQSTNEGINSCSHTSIQLAAGETLYVHVIELGDNAAIAAYFLKLTFLNPLGTQNEIEPNEDGTPQTGGNTTNGNDFDAGGIAVANATAQGVITTDRLFTSGMPAGDEDVYAITNSGAVPVTFDAETFTGSVGNCATGDTVIQIRNAAGTSQTLSDDDGAGACSYVDNVPLAAGQTLYIHVSEYGDDAAIAAYQLLVTVN